MDFLEKIKQFVSKPKEESPWVNLTPEERKKKLAEGMEKAFGKKED